MRQECAKGCERSALSLSYGVRQVCAWGMDRAGQLQQCHTCMINRNFVMISDATVRFRGGGEVLLLLSSRAPPY